METHDPMLIDVAARSAAHSAILTALIACHPDKQGLKEILSPLMSRLIEDIGADPISYAALRKFEDSIRALLEEPPE